MRLTQQLKGGALYIALIISVVIGIVLSVFILIAYFNQRQVLSKLSLTQLGLNLKSGLSLARSENFSKNNNNQWQALPFNEDSLRIKKLQWGSFEMISVESKNRNHFLREAALYGEAAGSDTAIVVTDRGRPIGLSGKIRFNGQCYFPRAGIKPAYIEGESLNSDGPLNSFIRPAPMELPAVKTQLIESLKRSMHEADAATDSLVTALPQELSVGFSAKTALLKEGHLSLFNHHLSGNIKLVANDVLIDESSRLDNILIVANKVHIKKGFKGSLHVIASDSIVLEDDCLLEYPSSLTLLNEDVTGTGMKGIYLGQRCLVQGAVIALNKSGSSQVMVKMSKECEIDGLVYSANYAHVQGKVFGTVFCTSLLLTTPSAVYENHLLGCELDPKKYGHSLAVPSIFKTLQTYIPCKWL